LRDERRSGAPRAHRGWPPSAVRSLSHSPSHIRVILRVILRVTLSHSSSHIRVILPVGAQTRRTHRDGRLWGQWPTDGPCLPTACKQPRSAHEIGLPNSVMGRQSQITPMTRMGRRLGCPLGVGWVKLLRCNMYKHVTCEMCDSRDESMRRRNGVG
jgi:hypothetical protein